MGYIFLLRGVPAFVVLPEITVPVLCRLTVRYSEADKRAAILLRLMVDIHGFDEPQLFDLVQGPTNWVPEEISWSNATENLSQNQLVELARKGRNPVARTLSLSLRTPCTIRCSSSIKSIAPKLYHKHSYHHLLSLSRTTRFNIIFDVGRLEKQSYSAFFSIVSYPQCLTDLPAERYHESWRQLDWTDLSPEDCELPSYAAVSAKRPREGSPSPNPSPPKRERVRDDPLPFSTIAAPPTGFIPGSPTEKATTTTASPSPQPSSPRSGVATDVERTIDTLLEKRLPAALQKMIPDMLARMFTVPLPNAEPSALRSVTDIVSARIVTDAGSYLDQVRADMIDDAQDVRRHGDDEFFEALHEHKVDLLLAKDGHVAELKQEFQSKVEELHEEMAGLIEDTKAEMEECADTLCMEARNRLEEIGKATCLQQSCSIARLSRQGRRAVSLPL